MRQPGSLLLRALAPLALLLALAPAAQAAPLPLQRDDVPGLRPTGGAGPGARAALAALVRPRARPLARRGALAATAYRGGGLTLVSGVLLPGSAARATALAGSSVRFRSSVGRRRSEAIALVRVRDAVLVVRVRAARRDPGVRAAARGWLALLRARVEHERPASAIERVLRRIEPDGTIPLAVALQGFEAVYGDLPGVATPPGARSTVESGTQQLAWIVARWTQLTPAQQAAVADRLGMDVALGAPAAPATRGARRAAPIRLTPSPTFQAIADPLVAAFSARLGGFALPWPVRVYRIGASLGEAAADAAPVDAGGRLTTAGGVVQCQVRLPPLFLRYSAPIRRFVLAHEVFHCFQFALAPAWSGLADWIREGTADWAATQVASAAQASGWYHHDWRGAPAKQLFGRAYDASGFWGLAHERGGDLWPRITAILQSTSNEQAYALAGGDLLAETWASGIVGKAGPWNQTSPWAASARPDLAAIVPLSAGGGSIGSPAYGARVYRVSAPPGQPLLFPSTSTGYLRAGLPADDGNASGKVYCLGGRCECPVGLELTLDGIVDVPGKLLLGLAGGAANGDARLAFRKVRDFCRRRDPARTPPASTNGDPHLQTLDGLRYDFQAAGEFVLVRSRSGDLEVQARQERAPGFDGGGLSSRATVNTMLGLRVRGRRVTVARSEGAPVVRVDGALRLAGAADATLPLGGGASAARSDGAVVVTWPDGSEVRVASVGRWGVAASVRLAAGRAGAVRGLLGDFDGDPTDDLATRAGRRIAYRVAQRDSIVGIVYEVVDGWRRPFFDALYDRVGESWRVAQRASLLRYGAGQTTRTFTDRSVPERPLDYERLSREARARALAICRAAGVSGDLALEDCVEDVVATGDADFARAAAEAEAAANTRWLRLSAGAAVRDGEDAVRAPDGSLVLLYDERAGTSGRRLSSVRVAPDGTESAPTVVLDADADGTFAVGLGGTLEAFMASLREGATPSTGIYRSSAPAPFGTWTEGAAVTGFGTSYAARPEAVVLPDGTPLVASTMAGAGRIFRGDRGLADPGSQIDPDPDCYASSPALVRDGAGGVWAAWARWDCPPPLGIMVARVDAATGAVMQDTRVQAPGSQWLEDGAANGFLPSLSVATAFAVGPGGVPVVAYATYRPDRGSSQIRLFTPGRAPIAVAELSGRASTLLLESDPSTGRLWLAWPENQRLKVVRTRPGSLALDGSPAVLGQPPGIDPFGFWTWALVPGAGGADVVFWGAPSSDLPGVIWRSRVG